MNNSNSEMRAQLLKLVATRPAPTHSEWRRHCRLVLSIGAAWLLGTTLLLLRIPARVDWHWSIASACWFGLLAIMSGYAAISHGGSSLSRSRWQMLAVALATMLLALAIVGVAQFIPDGPAAEQPSPHFACFRATVMMALGPFVAVLMIKRGSDYVRPRISGLLIGAMSGALGALGISLHCAEQAALHLLLGHAFPVLALGFLGWAMGDRVVGGHLKR